MNDKKFKMLKQAIDTLVDGFLGTVVSEWYNAEYDSNGGTNDRHIFHYTFENGITKMIVVETEMIGSCTNIKSITFN